MNTAEVQEKIRQMESPDEEVDLDGDMVIVSNIELAELQQQVEAANLHHFDVMEDVRKAKENTASTIAALETRIRDLEIERDLKEEDWGRRSVTRSGLERLRLRQEQKEAAKDREVEALEARIEEIRKESSQLRYGDVLQKEAEHARDEAQKWDEESRKLHEELKNLDYEVSWEARDFDDLQVRYRDLMGETMALEQQAREQVFEVQGLQSGNMELGIRLEWLEAKLAEVQTSSAETSGSEAPKDEVDEMVLNLN